MRRRATLSVLFLIVFIDLVGFGMIIPVLPLYAEHYDPSPLAFGALMAAYSALQFVFSPILGRLSDRFGRRPVLLLSLLGAAAGYGLLAFADSLAMLFASRIIAGAFAGNIATVQAIIADTTGPEGRTQGMGVIGAAFGLGFIAGPALGAGLDLLAPWLPGAFAATTSLVACGLTWLLVPETRVALSVPAPRRVFDVSLLLETMGRPVIAGLLVAVLLLVTAFSIFEVTFAQFASRALAIDPDADRARIYGLFIYAGVLAAVIQGVLVGRLARRFGDAKLAIAGSAIAAVALALVPSCRSMPALLGAIAGLAIGQGLAGPTLSSLISTLAPPDRVGGVLGLYQSLSSLARIAGPLIGQWSLGVLGLAWPHRIGAGLEALAAVIIALAVFAWARTRSTAEATSPVR